MEKYKDFLSSTVAFLYLSVDICPRHPSTQKGRIWRLTANQLHGTFTPGVVLTRSPHWLRRIAVISAWALGL
jgi:hypothetical protein